MRTIFISSFHPLISRNILSTGVLSHLLENNIKIVLLVPEAKVEYFQETFKQNNIYVEGITIPKKRFDTALHILSMSLVGVENHIVRNWKTEKKYIKYYASHAIYHLFSHFSFPRKLLAFVVRGYINTGIFDVIFKKYNPSLVVATDSFDYSDRALLIAAEKQNVKSLGMIRSWDNATTKGVFFPRPDHIIVTNEVLKEEMNTIHRIPLDNITVVGVPHYDRVGELPRMSKEEVWSRVGLDPHKKTVFYSPGGRILYKHDNDILGLFKKHIDNGDFNDPVQFIVSIPPSDTIETSNIENDSNFIIYKFGTNITGRRKESEMVSDENELLNAFWYYSDAIVTLVSTVAIDGTVFQKPVIVFAFNPKENVEDKIEKFAKYKHFEKFLNTGLVTISQNDAEFVAQLNTVLENPNYNKEDRDALIARYAFRLDGKSAERLATKLLVELDKT